MVLSDVILSIGLGGTLVDDGIHRNPYIESGGQHCIISTSN